MANTDNIQLGELFEKAHSSGYLQAYNFLLGISDSPERLETNTKQIISYLTNIDEKDLSDLNLDAALKKLDDDNALHNDLKQIVAAVNGSFGETIGKRQMPGDPNNYSPEIPNEPNQPQ